MSRPNSSVPKGRSVLGGCSRSAVNCSVGPKGATSGPIRATKAKKATSTAPVMARRCWRMLPQRLCRCGRRAAPLASAGGTVLCAVPVVTKSPVPPSPAGFPWRTRHVAGEDRPDKIPTGALLRQAQFVAANAASLMPRILRNGSARGVI